MERDHEIPMSSLPFRQDSTFLYFTGISDPNFAVYIETDGSTTLFGFSPPEDDALWHGVSPSLEQTTQNHGMQSAFDMDAVDAFPFANNTATIAVPDYKKTALLNSLLKKKYRFGVDYGDPDLVEQIIRMRRVKDTWEVSEMQRAADHSVAAHMAVMSAKDRAFTNVSWRRSSGVLGARDVPLDIRPFAQYMAIFSISSGMKMYSTTATFFS